MRYVYKKKILIVFASIFDFMGNILFYPVKKRGLSPKGTVPTLSRLLIIRCDHIGDVISATPVIKALERSMPEVKTDFIVSPIAAEVLGNNLYLNKAHKFDAPWFRRERQGLGECVKGFLAMVNIMKKGGYDTVIDLRGDLRHILAMFFAGIKRRISYGITGGGFLLTDVAPYEGVMPETERDMELLKFIGITGKPEPPSIWTRDEDINKAVYILRSNNVNGPFAVFHPFPGRPEKAWTFENFAKVISYVCHNKKLIPVVVGSEKDAAEINKMFGDNDAIVNLAGKTTIPVLYHIIEKASIFIGVDSGPAHVAAATGKPVILLFSGVNDPSVWAPGGPNIKLIYPGAGKDLSGISLTHLLKAIDNIV